MASAYEVKSSIRRFFLETDTLHLAGLPTKFLVDTTGGIPSYSQEELPKIHIEFSPEQAEEDTLNLNELLMRTTMQLKLYYPSDNPARGALRRRMQQLSLELSSRVRKSDIIGAVDHLVSMNQIEANFTTDRTTSPPIAICTHRYLIAFKWGRNAV